MNTEEIKNLIESNSNYWKKRALENKLNIIENEMDYLKRLDSIYNEAMKQIDTKLGSVYARYAENNKLTLKQAYKRLSKAMEKNYKNDIMDYIAKAKSGDPKWQKYLLDQSLMHQHSVLDQLRTEYRNIVYNIDMQETGGKFLEKVYTNANYYAQYTSNGSSKEEVFAHVDQEKIKRLLTENWTGGGNFSQLIWKNKEQLVQALDDIVIKGLAVGDGYDKMSKELAKRMDVSVKAAKRLIMTESARMDNEGLLEHYRNTGVEQLVFVATLDSKTSEICRAMDGTIINVEDAHIGLNVPPLHPYCRSVISPYYEFNEVTERLYKNAYGKTRTGRNRTYAQYVEEELGDFQQAKAITSTQNTIANLVRAVGTIAESSVSVNNVVITNPNYTAALPDADRETLLTMKGPTINDINTKLANELKMTKEMEKKIADIDKALDKLPFFQGNVTTDIRLGANNPLDDMSVGEVWNVKKYLFSTKKDKYYDNTQYRFIITSKTGRDIGKKITNYKVNEEVIFKRNSKFLINEIKVKKGTVYYYLEELV